MEIEVSSWAPSDSPLEAESPIAVGEQHRHLQSCLTFLLGFTLSTLVHWLAGGGGQHSSSFAPESVASDGWLSSCSVIWSGWNGFLVVGIRDTSSSLSRTLGLLEIKDLVSVTLTPHNVMTFAWVGLTAGSRFPFGQSRA